MNIACSSVSLRELPLFSSLTDAERSAIQPLSQIRNHPAGSDIIKRGDAVDGIYLLLAGAVNVLLEDSRGHKVIVDTLGENETFSELGVFQESSSPLTFACVRACQVLHVPREALAGALNGNCRLATFIARALAHRLEHSYRKLVASDRAALQQWAVRRRNAPPERKHAAAAGGPVSNVALATAAT